MWGNGMGKKAAVALAAVLLAAYFAGLGFVKNPSVSVNGYSISNDGREIVLYIEDAPNGYARKAVEHQQHGGRLYVDFYYAFGGRNGKIGAKTGFALPLEADTDVIAIYRNTNCYGEILRKDSDGIWQPVE